MFNTKMLLMTGFEPWTSGIGSNWATIAVQEMMCLLSSSIVGSKQIHELLQTYFIMETITTNTVVATTVAATTTVAADVI